MTSRADSRDLALGGLLIGIGLLASVIAGGYGHGTLRFMGPGFAPTWLGRGLAVLGALILIRGLRAAAPAPWGTVPWRALVLIPSAVLVFGLVVPRGGLLLACLAAALTAALAVPGLRLGAAVLVSAALAAGFTLLFAVLLRVPLPLWPEGVAWRLPG